MSPWKVLAWVACAAGIAGAAWLLGATGGPPVPRAPEGAVEDPASPAAPALAGRPEDGAASARTTGSAPDPADPVAPSVLVVTVRAAPSGEAIAGATVVVRAVEGEDLASAPTGPDGIARFLDLSVDRVEVITRAPGRTPDWATVSDVRSPGERTISVVLEPGVAISGVVLAAVSRRPVAGARVTAVLGGSIAEMSSAYSGPPLDVTQADGEGRFRVEGIPLAQISSIDVEAPGFVRSRRSFLLGEGATDHPPVEVVLDAAATATGRVTDPDGRRVTGATVRALPEAHPGDASAVVGQEARIGPWGDGADAGPRAVTDAEGRYAVEGLRVGAAYRFYARAPGLARSALTDPPHTARVPGPFGLLDLVLRRPATLRVRVVDTEGAPMERARVAMAHRGLDLVPQGEGAGTFRFDLLPAGAYEVLAEHAGRVPEKRVVQVLEGATAEERLVLARGVAVEGLVVDDRGAPVAGTHVSVGSGSVATDADGRFRVDGLAPGSHRASVGATGQGHAPVEVEAPATGVRLVRPRSATLRLRLVPPAGEPIPSRFEVSVEDVAQGSGTGFGRPWGDGRVVLEEVPPVPTRVVVQVEGYAPLVREEALSPGEDRDLGALTLDAGVELTGRIMDAAGLPLPGARARVSLPGFMADAVATAGADGRFRVSRLPRGERSVLVEAEALLSYRVAVVLDGPTTTRTFTLVPPVRVTGTVRDAAGRGVEGVDVVLLLQGEAPPGVPREREGSTDTTGAWEVQVAAGTHVVEVRGEEDRVLLRRDAPITVPLGAPLDIHLP